MLEHRSEIPGSDASLVTTKVTLPFYFKLLKAHPPNPCPSVLYKLNQAIEPVNTTLLVLTHDFFFPRKKKLEQGWQACVGGLFSVSVDVV